MEYPFQLFRQTSPIPIAWENLSLYASVADAVRTLLKELLPGELAEEVYHGQASVSPQPILDRLNRGEHSVSVFYSIDNGLFRAGTDVIFEDLIHRT